MTLNYECNYQVASDMSWNIMKKIKIFGADLSVLDVTVWIVKTWLEKVILGMIHFSTH